MESNDEDFQCVDGFESPGDELLISGGCFGDSSTYKVLHRDQLYAAKKIECKDCLDKKAVKKNISFCFQRVLDWSSHVNELYGYAVLSKHCYLFSPYCEHGSIESLIDEFTLSKILRLKLMNDAATGLSWIKEVLKVSHGDVKPSNILIDSNINAKVGDFGIRAFNSALNNPSPPRNKYEAPELHNTTNGTLDKEKADVYSYGITLYSVFADQLRYSSDETDSVLPGTEVDVDEVEIQTTINMLVKACVETNPSDRHSFKSIVDSLKTPLEERKEFIEQEIKTIKEKAQSDKQRREETGATVTETGTMGAGTMGAGTMGAGAATKPGTVTDTVRVDIKLKNISSKRSKNKLKELKLKDNRTLTKWLAKKFKCIIVQYQPSSGHLFLKFRERILASKFKENVDNGHLSNYLSEHVDGNSLFEAVITQEAWNFYTNNQKPEQESDLPSSDLESDAPRVDRPSKEQDSSPSDGTSSYGRSRGKATVVQQQEAPTQHPFLMFYNLFLDEKSTFYVFKRLIESNISDIQSNIENCPLIHACLVKNRTDLLRAVYWTGLWDKFANSKVPNECWPFLKDDVGKTVFEIAKQKPKNIEDDLIKFDDCDKEAIPLRKAIRTGGIAVISRIVQASGNSTILNDLFSDGLTPLHWACVMGNLSVFKKLVDLGADVKKKMESGESLLHLGCALGRHDIVKYLLDEAKLDTTERGPSGRSPVDYAAETGDIKLFECLVQCKARIEYSALILSCMKGKAEFLRAMHNRCRLDLGYQDRYGRTPLHHAADNGHVDVIKLLLEKGAKIDAVDKNNRNMLHVLADRGHPQALLDLRGHITRSLLEKRDRYIGADNCFLVKGSDNGRQAFHYVEVKRKFIRVFLARTRGGNLDIANYGMVIRSGWGTEATVEDIRVIEKRYDDRIQSSEVIPDMTPLHMACVKEKWDVVPVLIELGADVNATDSEGCTPLHITAMRGDKATAQVLINAGCNIAIKDKDGMDALQIAKDNNNIQIQRMLQTITACDIIKNDLVSRFARMMEAVNNENISLDVLEETIVPSLTDINERTQKLLQDFGSGPVAEESNS